MSDIVLNDIGRGFNRSVINDNFDILEQVVNNDVLHLDGGNNIMQQNIDMNSNSILNAVTSDDPGSLVNKSYVDAQDALKVSKSGDSMSGQLAMVGNKIVSLGDGTDSNDAVNLQQVLRLLTGAGVDGVVPSVQPRQVGDGTTTTFSTPAIGLSEVSPNSFFVSQDGVSQRPVTDFDINAGGYVVFEEAPALNIAIDITYFNPVSLGDLSSADVTATGTTTPRTLGDRFADVVSVKDFGAVGDGVTDDTAAIQAAFDTGGPVYIPEGDYKINELGIRPLDDTSVRGDGKNKTILSKFGGLNNLEPILRERVIGGVFTPVYNFSIEGVSFVGNGDAAIPSAKGAGLIRFYETHGMVVRDCDFSKSKGYGIGFQGSGRSENVSKAGANMDILIDNCDFFGNGLPEYLTGVDTDDGIDCKNAYRVVINNCRAWDNGDKGFDVRAQKVSMSNCYSWGNVGAGFAAQVEGVLPSAEAQTPATIVYTSCHAFDNGGNGFAVVPQVDPDITIPSLQIVTFVGCEATNNQHNFSVTSVGTNQLTLCHVEINGCQSYHPASGFRHYNGSGACESLSFVGGKYIGGDTTGISVFPTQEGNTTFSGCVFKDIGGSAISGPIAALARMAVGNCTFDGIGSVAVEGGSNCTISGNSYKDVSSSALIALSGTNNRMLDKDVGARTATAATTLDIDERTDFWVVAGTTTIQGITPSWTSRIITLRFTATTPMDDTGNIKLSGPFTASSNDTMHLISEGGNWYEISRSAN